MNPGRVLTLGAALLLASGLPACRHTAAPESVCAVPEKTGGSSYAFAVRCQEALERYIKDYDRLPRSIRDLSPNYLPADSLSSFCPDGTVQEHVVVDYRRYSDADGTVTIRHYLRGGALLSSQKLNIRNLEYKGGMTEHHNVAPR